MSGPHQLRTNGRAEPLGIGTPRPEFAWSTPADSAQETYQLQVSASAVFAASELVWESGIVQDAKPFGAAYCGMPLRSRTRYWWRVRTTGGSAVSPWSDPSWFETGLLGGDDLTAQWISAPDAGPDDRRALYFRKTAEVTAPVVRARAYVSALGWYRLFVNDHDITGQALVPRWTPFDESVEYQAYDVTEAFRTPGDHLVGLAAADGRFRGTLGYQLHEARYGTRIGVFAEVILEFADGSEQRIVTDESWQVGLGRIRTADPIYGERADLRIAEDAWLDQSTPLEHQTFAVVLPSHSRKLIAEDVDRVATLEERPATITTAPSGSQILDFGQNFSGVVALVLRGDPGTTVCVRYSEAITPTGELDTAYLTFADEQHQLEWFQRDQVTLGDGATRYCPWFTIHGFRYASVDGAAPLAPADVTGYVMSTEMPQIARFQASDPRLERLWSNSLWSLRSNFTDTPTDCPTRERSGWTGDIQLFGSTAVQLVDAGPFLRRYLRNLAVEQYADGRVPPYIPSEWSAELGPHHMEYVSTSVGWSDVSVLLPWTLYEYRGDAQVLRDQYQSAKKWVDHLAWRAAKTKSWHRRFGRRFGKHEKYIVDTGFHWGEWLRPGEGNTWWKSKLTPPASLATAYFANSAATLARIAEVIGEPDDAAHYRRLHESAKAAWRAAFVRRRGARIGEDKQDDYVRALTFDLLPRHERAAAAARLVALIRKAGTHLGTGFLSTPLLLPALVDSGHSDVAHDLLFQTTPPSWLAQVEAGATTIWEKWQAYDDEGNAHDSLNHYAFGSVTRFLHEYVAGLAPAAPGYSRIRFASTYPAQLESASLELETPYGTAASSWKRTIEGIKLTVLVPAGSSGVVHLPGGDESVGAGTHTFTFPNLA